MWNKKSWPREVGEIFNTLPRNGKDKHTFWMSRKHLEERLLAELEAPGVHVCIDGPTGTGKTSLAKTVLMKGEIPHRLIQITKSMTWTDFCFRVIKEKSNVKSQFSANIEVGLNRGLPSALLKLAAGSEKSDIDDQELRKRISNTITEDILCDLMAQHDVALFVDDFERASKSLVVRISDMCKLLTESYVSNNAKLVIVGTDDIYTRLTCANKSLEDRVYELSVGTFSNPGESWKFILNGLELLKTYHPVVQYNNGQVTIDDLKKCQSAVYEAVDGLPKGLNKLGREIALNARGKNKNITVDDVLKASLKIPGENIRKAGNKFPGIKRLIGNPIVSNIIKYMYEKGINQIHRVYDIVGAVEEIYQEGQILHALDELKDADFITITGTNRDILHVTDPTMAHTLGVINSFPDKYDVPSAFKFDKGPFQFSLPLSTNDSLTNACTRKK